MRRIVLSCIVAGALASPALQYGNSDAITEDELKAYLYFLASDPLEGRSFPSRGYDTAALYVASHLAEWGLKPGGSSSSTNGPLQPYLMPIEMVARQIVPEQSKLSLIGPPAGGRGGRYGGGGAVRGSAGADPQTTNFEYSKDWTAAAGGGRGGGPNAVDVSGNLVFAGNGYVIEKSKTNPYEGLDIKGKIVVVAGLPPELAAFQQEAGGRGGRGGRGAAQNPLGEPCTDYFTPEQYAARNGALAVVTVANFQQLAAMGNPASGGRGGGGRGALNGPAYQVVKFQHAAACPGAPSVIAGVALTTALFQGERLNGSQVFYAAGSNGNLESFAINERKKLDIHLAVRSEPGHGENVIGVLEGSDPDLKREFVIVSAHLDHLGLAQPQPGGHAVYNGADDDGSGCAGLLSIAHAYAAGAANGIRPKRSILFLWNGGEERGLWGSRYFTEFPPIDLSKVVADLNMDMIGRTKNPQWVDSDPTHLLVGPGEILLVGPNVSSDDLGNTIDAVNAGFQKLKIDHFYDTTAPDDTHDNLGPAARGQRIFYRSDHYNFAKMGIPIAFFTTGLHADYHRASDTPEKIDFTELQMVAKTVAAVGWELAGQTGRPKIKDKLPDELLRDMKTVQSEGWGKVTPVLQPLPGMPY